MFDVAHWRSTWNAVLIALNQYDPSAHEWAEPGGRVEAEKIAHHIADVVDSYRERHFGSDSVTIYELTDVIVDYYDNHKVGSDPYITRFAGNDEPMWGSSQFMRIDEIGNMLERALDDHGVAAWIVGALRAEYLVLDLALKRLGRRMQDVVELCAPRTPLISTRPLGSIMQLTITVGVNNYRDDDISIQMWPTGENAGDDRLILRSTLGRPNELGIVKCWTPLGQSLTMIEDMTLLWPSAKSEVDELMMPWTSKL